MSSPTFDVEFEEQILAEGLRSAVYMRNAAPLLDRRHFTTPQHEWVWRVEKETWTEFSELPSAKVFMVRAGRDFEKEEDRGAALKLVVRLFKTKPDSARVALDELRRFTQAVALQSTLEESLRLAEKGEWERAFEPIRRVAREDFRPRAYTAVEWIEEFEERQRARRHRKEHPDEHVCIPTGIKRLDAVMAGGVRSKEFNIVMGVTGRGKSIFLTHLGFQALMRGFHVLHVSLEMGHEIVSTRYDSRWSGMLHSKFKMFDFDADEEAILARRLAKVKARFAKKLRIVSMPVRSCDINVLRAILSDARATRPIALVILDSPDHMKSLSGFREKRDQAADVYWDVKNLCEEENVACWGAMHAAKVAASKTADAESAADSYDKARIVDSIVSLNQPASRSRSKVVEDDDDDDRPPEPKGDIELFLAKLRDGASKIRIPLAADLTRILIRDLDAGETEEKEE